MIFCPDAVINNNNLGYIKCPTIPFPHLLCEIISFSLIHSETAGALNLDYNPKTNKVQFYSSTFPEGTQKYILQVSGSALAQLLGFTSQFHAKEFSKFAQSYVENCNSTGSRAPFILPSETLSISCRKYGVIDPGYYSPSHRPMCVGNPLKITTEFENALNKLYFPFSGSNFCLKVVRWGTGGV